MSEPAESGTGKPVEASAAPAQGANSGTPAAEESSAQGAVPGGYHGEFFTEEPPQPEAVKAPRRVPKPSPLILGGFALLAAIMVALVLSHHSSDTPASDSEDLGDAVYKAGGLRGHMLARWDGKLHYQVHIEPIDPTVASTFNFTLSNPPHPIDVTLRLLDSSGFALCQKTVLVPFDAAKSLGSVDAHPPTGKAALARFQQEQAARQAQIAHLQAQEQDRIKGQDVFQNQLNADGEIVALDAQGDFPCDRKSYRHVDYWDMVTSYPTLDEQQALLNQKQQDADRRATESRRTARLASARRFGSAFYVQGDEHVTSYDAARALLTTSPGRTFSIPRKQDQTIAAAWASNYSLIHYKCDQQASCALTHSGTANAILGKLNQ